MLLLRQALFLMGCLLCASPVQAAESGWHEFTNTRQGYSVSLPSELRMTFERQNDPELSAQNLMPFDYVNFRPGKDVAVDLELIELGIGVHHNRKNRTVRAFADNKDVGVRAAVKQFVTRQAYEVVVAGIKGVRDDFSLEKESGWISYSRVIIPYRDTFIVFLFTTGWETPVPACEQLFQKILDSFKIGN
ncbi:MAG TPA: hypothetical protein P5110_04400 [Candidatus Omnitrophota bacterium]|nr:hypothetical protein [Candidatus Omnitrophota bacterium]HRZ14732.1 hypothetical protein [Candidatus Omnitrophota bacterium]